VAILRGSNGSGRRVTGSRTTSKAQVESQGERQGPLAQFARSSQGGRWLGRRHHFSALAALPFAVSAFWCAFTTRRDFFILIALVLLPFAVPSSDLLAETRPAAISGGAAEGAR